VIRGTRRDYLKRHPGPGDLGLVVEVADTTLKRDRIVKKRIYATAGIPFYWVLDLTRHRLVVYSEPQGGDYAQRVLYAPDQSVAVILDGHAVGDVAVSELLP
jgi:Uma2 family endonuclease